MVAIYDKYKMNSSGDGVTLSDITTLMIYAIRQINKGAKVEQIIKESHGSTKCTKDASDITMKQIGQ